MKKKDKYVPSRAEIAAQLESMALSFALTAEKLDAMNGEYDKDFAAACRRIASRYKARSERMGGGDSAGRE